jgi:hypothetical protein
MGTVYEDVSTFKEYLAEFFLEWELFPTKLCRKSQHTLYVP